MENQPQDSRSAFAQEFERKVKLARHFGFLERAWERAALPVGGVAGAFLTASWFGLWQNVTPSVRMAGVVLFSAALAAAIRPLFRLQYPTREDALERMNKATGLPGRLASTYDDIPVDGTDEQSRAIWDFQRARIERKVGHWKAGAPRSNLVHRDPFALRFALAMVTGISLVAAHSADQVGERITAVMDWKTDLNATLAKIDAWVTPPNYTGAAPIYIASTENRSVTAAGSGYTIPEGSVLTLRLHDQYARVAVSGGTTEPASSCRPNGKVTECRFELSGDAGISVHSARTGTVNWQFNVTPDLPPRIVVAPAPAAGEGRPATPGATYALEDEYGAEVIGGRIEMPAPRNPDARPLPLFGLPTVPVPVK